MRRAAPGPLERHFSFGVVRALLEARCARRRRAAPARRRRGGPATLLLDGAAPADSTQFAHSVLWLCSALAERRPLALVVDDAQWADRSSLEVLSYLARRAEDLPLLILSARAPTTRDAASDLLSLLGTCARRPCCTRRR